MNIHSRDIARYPRTAHLQGSRLQPGDDASDQLPLAQLAGRFVVIEEKMDGANCGLSFDEGGELHLFGDEAPRAVAQFAHRGGQFEIHGGSNPAASPGAGRHRRGL